MHLIDQHDKIIALGKHLFKFPITVDAINIYSADNAQAAVL